MIAIKPRMPPATATFSRTSTSAITIRTAISPPTIVIPFVEPLNGRATRTPRPDWETELIAPARANTLAR